jgi:CO/xanthine dehydrogenase FAD-binding subunit
VQNHCRRTIAIDLDETGIVAPKYLIDIKNAGAQYIKLDLKEGLKIGATTTHRAIEKSSVINKKFVF